MNGRYISPVFGSKVYSEKQNDILYKILDRTTINFNDWAFFVGRLKSFGFSVEEQLGIIDKYNRWKTYNRAETLYQLRKRYIYIDEGRIYSKGREFPSFEFHTSPPTPTLTDIDIIKLFLDKCDPWDLKPPKTIKDAVIYYYFEGAHVIPMRNGEKKPYWGLSWQEYQNRQPTKDEIVSWNWSYGICLLGTEKHCALDIDIKSPSHPQGLANFNKDVLDGWCYERTKNGGYHVFGCGNFPVIRGDAVGIHGRGAYVVTSPTDGYTFHHHG